MWIEVPPGRHRLDLRNPKAPMPVPRGEAEPESASIAFDLPADETAALDLRIGVTGAPDPEQAVLHGWSCRVERIAEPGAEAPIAPPKVDVKGAVRRAASGRWREVLDS